MGSLLAICPVHGGFTVNNLIGGDGALVMAGVATTCPRCGRPSPIRDGEYELRDSLRLPTIYRPTPAQARRLYTVAQWAQAEMNKPDGDAQKTLRALENGIEKDAPQIKTWLDRVRDQFKANPAGWIAVLIALLTLLVSQQQQHGISADELEQILHRVVRDVQLEQVTPEIGAPRHPLSEQPVPAEVPTVTEPPTPKTR